MVRRLAPAAIACLAGAALALYGATRVWSVRVTPRPGLSDLRADTTGAQAQPWLIALALIALAGTGALLATRGLTRRLLGGLIAAAGLGVAVAALAGRAGLDPGAAGTGATGWPIVCVLGGALVVLAGASAARHGHEWPAMGARYERRAVPPPRPGPGAGSGPSPAAGPRTSRAGDPAADAPGPAGGPPTARGGGPVTGASGPGADAGRPPSEAAPVDTRAAWDALDRGEDPTTR